MAIVAAATRGCAQARISGTSPISDLNSTGSRAPSTPPTTDLRGVYLAGAIALIALSAAINIRHAIARQSDLVDAALAAGLALSMTVAFIVLPALAAGAFRERMYGFCIMAVVGALISGGISLTNIAGASMGARLTTAADAGDAHRRRADTLKTIQAHEAEVAALGTTRRAGEIHAEINTKLASRRDLDGCEARWLSSVNARQTCIEVHALRAELAKADRRTELERSIGELRNALNQGTRSAETIGSGDTAAIIAAGRKFGVSLDAETVDLAKSIGLAVAVELFAALLLMAWERGQSGASGTSGHLVPVVKRASVPGVQGNAVIETVHETRHMLAAQVSQPSVPAIEDHRERVTAALQAVEVETGVPVSQARDNAPEAKVLAILRERGGSLLASQRVMAETFGLSRSSVNRVLHSLAADGRVRLVTTAKGTAVTLAAKW